MKTPVSLRGRDFLRIRDFTAEELESVLDLADELKENPQPLLPQKTLGLVFGQPSTRTRISFATAIIQLGGGFLTGNNAGGNCQLQGDKPGIFADSSNTAGGHENTCTGTN